MITLDIPAYIELKTIAAKIIYVIYQWILVFAFLIGGRVRSGISKAICKGGKYYPKYFEDISGARCYPYYYSWKNTILSFIGIRRKMLSGYNPSVPIVFIYGEKKVF